MPKHQQHSYHHATAIGLGLAPVHDHPRRAYCRPLPSPSQLVPEFRGVCGSKLSSEVSTVAAESKNHDKRCHSS